MSLTKNQENLAFSAAKSLTDVSLKRVFGGDKYISFVFESGTSYHHIDTGLLVPTDSYEGLNPTEKEFSRALGRILSRCIGFRNMHPKS